MNEGELLEEKQQIIPTDQCATPSSTGVCGTKCGLSSDPIHLRCGREPSTTKVQNSSLGETVVCKISVKYWK